MRTAKRRRLILFTSILASSLAIAVITFATKGLKKEDSISAGDDYYLALNKNNAYSGADQDISTASGKSKVRFHYEGASSASNAHVALSNGGLIVNSEQITSINHFSIDFSGALKARLSLDKSTWGEYFTLKDDASYQLSTDPYYIEIKATAATTINSVSYTYSCSANPNAESDVSEVGTEKNPLTPQEAIAMMDKAGAGNIVGTDKLYCVKGVVDEGSTVNKNYSPSQWYCNLGGTEFKISGATNQSGVSISETNGALDGRTVVVKGYMELYNNVYKIGYLPASASPTHQAFIPSIIEIDSESSGGEEQTVSVTGVSLSPKNVSLTVGENQTLTATVSPSNATNKSVSWKSSNTSVATVSNGEVTAKAAGSATITVTTADGNLEDTCVVTVTSSSTGSETTIDLTAQGFSNQQEVTTVNQNPFTLTFAKGSGSNDPRYYTSGTSVRTYADNTLTVATSSSDKITKIVFTLGGTTSATPTASTGSYNGNTKTWTGSATSIVFTNASSGQYHYKAVTITVTPSTPVEATDLSIDSIEEIAVGKSKTLSVTYTPANANTGLAVTWESSNTDVATVDSEGKVTVKNTATVGATVTITATLASNSKTSSCVVTVVEEQKSDYTLLFYVCGSNLESGGGGCATSDLREVLQVRAQQPESVKIVVETGGANNWSMSNVSASELGRYEINSSCSSQLMTKVGSATKANMGEASTLQDFLEWGFENYPANKYGLFMWNHGGAMDGCCFDELYDNDGLYTNEVDEAVTNARKNAGIEEKLEFIAYDACLMAVQDIAEMNSHNFNYMLSSQETEWSGGYDYDKFLPTLYTNPKTVSTKTLLQKVADTFLDEQEDMGHNDQTQSVYDLSKMSDYLDTWEDMTDTLKTVVNSSSKWTTFANAVNTANKYGQYQDDYGNPDSDYTDYNNAYVYDIFDVVGAFTQLKKTYSSYTTLVNKFDAVLTEFDKVVVYERHGSKMSGSNGMCMFCPISGYNQYEEYVGQNGTYPPNYSAERTNFTKWQAFVQQYGSWYK